VKILSRLSGILLGIERGVLVLLFSAMILLAFTQVVLRNFFSVGLVWGDPLLRNAVLWLGFIGASLATQQDKHIRIDLAGRYLGPRAATVVGMVTDLFTLAVCLLLADASRTFVLNEVEFQDTLVTIGQLEVPTWWSQVILPAGFLLISLRIVIRAALRLGGAAPAAAVPGGPGPIGGEGSS
jgi:TRAP-type C4-dicarboxylate transport system permease small subunit